MECDKQKKHHQYLLHIRWW